MQRSSLISLRQVVPRGRHRPSRWRSSLPECLSRPLTRDLGLALGLVMWNYLYTSSVNPDTGQRIWPYDPPETYLLPLLGIWVVVVGRRRCPEVAVVACAVLDLVLRGTDVTSDPMPTACAAFALALYRSGRCRAWGLGLALSVYAASVPVADRSLHGLVVTVATIGAGFVMGDLVERRRVSAGLAEQAALLRVRTAEQQVALTVAHDRQMVAREMHDVLSHGVSVMVRLSEAARLLGDRSGDDERRDVLLTEISAAGRGAITDMRRLLRVDVAAPHGAALDVVRSDSLHALVKRARLAGLPVDLEVDDPLLARCSTMSRRLVARAVQEGLTNAFRYADGATRVTVRVRPGVVEAPSEASTTRLVVVEVEDDGRGASVPLQGMLSGLIGLDEGVRAVGGRLEAGPRDDLDGRGWRLTMTLPEGEMPHATREPMPDYRIHERRENS